MKNEKNQGSKQVAKKEKRSVHDFEHQITFRLDVEDYVEYSQFQAAPGWKKSKKKAWLYMAIFGISGIVLLIRGLSGERSWETDLYIVAGVIALFYQGFYFIYTFFMFPKALAKAVRKEFAADSRLAQKMTLCFDDDKIVSFSGTVHQSTFFKGDILSRCSTENHLILVMRNGKNVVIPKRVLDGADEVIRQMIYQVKEG